ncbi:MAG: hypothetical protein DRP78_00710 [Candidatus Omnitrophota bacterium]|nr:MAG: hypothetical protein DRP78_00710 [Candidatus Omnitrophota bacterium]
MKKFIIYIVVILTVAFAFMQFLSYKKKGQGLKIKPVIVKNVSVNKNEISEAEINFKKALKLKEQDIQKAITAFEKIVTDFSEDEQASLALSQIANLYKQQGKVLEEKSALDKLLNSYSEAEITNRLKPRLWDINIDMLFSNRQTKDSMIYEVLPNDSLYKIAGKYNTTVDLLMKSNNLVNSFIKPGMKLKIVTSIFTVEVSKSKNTLILRDDNGVVKVYSVATGKDNCSPVGTFKIVNRIVNPVWYKTGAVVFADSPENILGTRWMGLSEPGYGIHGTTDPQSIGTQCTQGCVRMRNSEVEELFLILPVGTEVVIKD